MITINITSGAIRTAAILAAVAVLILAAVPASSGIERKLDFKNPLLWQIDLPAPEAKEFIARVNYMGVESQEGQKIGLAEVHVGYNQDIASGDVYCVLTDMKLFALFTHAQALGLDLRCHGTLVEAPEDTPYATRRLYLIESATTW